MCMCACVCVCMCVCLVCACVCACVYVCGVCVCVCVRTCMWLHMGEMRGESGHPISSFGSTSSLCHVLKPFDLTDEWLLFNLTWT